MTKTKATRKYKRRAKPTDALIEASIALQWRLSRLQDAISTYEDWLNDTKRFAALAKDVTNIATVMVSEPYVPGSGKMPMWATVVHGFNELRFRDPNGWLLVHGMITAAMQAQADNWKARAEELATDGGKK